MNNPSIELILCDVGGVLGTNGWDHEQRAKAATEFHFDYATFEQKHEEAVQTWECGRMTLAEYLDFTIFNEERPFTREAFIAFMYAQSVAQPVTIRLMYELALRKKWRMMTMNNESAELNAYRVKLFDLTSIFSAFITSAYIGAQKPHDNFYDRALGIAHAIPERTVFIDDREENLEPARQRGLHCVHAVNPEAVRMGLGALGVLTREI
ncbi:MAG: HAD-IA family hydrolase [Gemmatimonadaceae bacterium]